MAHEAGMRVKRVKVGQKTKGKDYEADEGVLEEGIVDRVYSWKWMKITTDEMETKYVRQDEYEEV